MIKTRFLLAAALLMVCPLAALADDVVPAAPVTPRSPVVPTSPVAPAAVPAVEAVILRYHFTQGQTRRYKLTMTMKGTILTGQSGAGVPINSVMSMIMKQTVKDVRAVDGAGTVESQIEDMQMSVDGKASPLPQAQRDLMKKPFTSLMLPTGKVLSVQMPTLPAGSVPGLDMSKMMPNNNVAFPEAPIKVGDTWSGEVDSGVKGMEMAVYSSLAGIKTSGDSQLAMINQKLKGTLNMTMSQGMPMTMKMTGIIHSSGSEVFDTTAGAIYSISSLINTNITMIFKPTPGHPAPSGMPQAMKEKLTQNTEMQLLDNTVQTPPVAPAAPPANVP